MRESTGRRPAQELTCAGNFTAMNALVRPISEQNEMNSRCCGAIFAHLQSFRLSHTNSARTQRSASLHAKSVFSLHGGPLSSTSNNSRTQSASSEWSGQSNFESQKRVFGTQPESSAHASSRAEQLEASGDCQEEPRFRPDLPDVPDGPHVMRDESSHEEKRNEHRNS